MGGRGGNSGISGRGSPSGISSASPSPQQRRLMNNLVKRNAK